MNKKDKKPRKEMINKARDIGFFSDEILSQEILDDADKLQLYIERNQTKLISNGVMEPKKNVPEFSDEEIRERKRWINRQIKKTVIFPLLIFAFISWCVLSTSVGNDFSEFVKLQDYIVRFFPKSQGWLYISPEFREKMLFIYPIFNLTFFYILVASVILVFRHRDHFGRNFTPLRNGMCDRFGAVLAGMIMFGSMLLLFTFSSYLSGSESLLQLADLDNDSTYVIHTDWFKWNTVWGFIFDKTVVAGLSGYAIFMLGQLYGTIKWCSSYR